MNLNPGQWILCHSVRCKSLKGMDCTEEQCLYPTERDKMKALKAQRRAHFDAIQEKQNTPRAALAASKAAEIAAKAKSRAEAISKGGR